MAYTTIDNPELYFQVKTYSGTGSSNAITLDGDENMQPDLVYLKRRDDGAPPMFFDAIRGATKRLQTNNTDAEATGSQQLTAFGSDGFTVGTNEDANHSSGTYVAWCWKAGTTSGISGSPSITPSEYSFNQTAGFSIIEFTTPGSSTGTVPHGLGVAPTVILARIKGSSSWQCGFDALQSGAWTSILTMNNDAAELTSNAAYGNTPPTSTLFTVNSANFGASGDAIAYCFAEKQGYSKAGSYTGNGNADGPFVYTGFRPAFVIIKETTQTDNWAIFDNKRSGYNSENERLYANGNWAEEDGSSKIDFLSNGFKLRDTWGSSNTSGETYIYMAFAEAPFVNSKGVPCNAR